MKTIVLQRLIDREYGTIGVLYGEQPICFTLELPWLGNRQNVSCIPEGSFNCAYLPRSASGRYRKVWHVEDVPGREGILIHAGNFAGTGDLRTDSWGCILPASRFGVLYGQVAGLQSRKALQLLRDYVGYDDFTLEVKRIG